MIGGRSEHRGTVGVSAAMPLERVGQCDPIATFSVPRIDYRVGSDSRDS